MTRRAAFMRGVTAGLLVAMSANAVNYFITPMSHPDDGAVRVAFAWIQLFAGLIGAVLMGRGVPSDVDKQQRV